MRHHPIHVCRLLVLALAICAGAGAAPAQEVTATILGTVTDPAGAVVPNAEVTLTNRNTREERRAQADDSGNYVLTQIQPGVYDLAVRMQGFKEVVNSGIEVNVNDRRTLNESA